MAGSFLDYFHVLQGCLGPKLSLSPTLSREQNYSNLREGLQKANTGRSQDDILAQILINRAMPIFQDEERYRDFLKEWKANAHSRSKDSGGESRRIAEAAQARARRAEEDLRRQAEKARALEQELEN